VPDADRVKAAAETFVYGYPLIYNLPVLRAYQPTGATLDPSFALPPVRRLA